MKKNNIAPVTIVLIWIFPYSIALIISNILSLNSSIEILINEIGLFIGTLLTYKLHKNSVKLSIISKLKNEKINPLLLINIFLLFVSFTMIVIYLAFMDGNYIEYEEAFNLTTVLSYLSIIVVNPFFEELVFRYMVIESMLEKYNKFCIVVISTLFFCIPHMVGIVSSFDIIISSILFSLIYIKTKNIIYTYIAHLSHNLTVEILLNTNINIIRSNILFIISSAIFIISAIILFITIRKKYK